jgi:cobalt transporter subunit CbtB
MSILSKAFGIELNPAQAMKLPAVALAFMLGTFLVYGVGFASPAEIHNAAHDGRHTFAFPCH